MESVYASFNYPPVTADVARGMGLNKQEFDKACDFLGRIPNYIELGCIAAMWSEHCSYKSSRLHLRKLPSKGENVVYGPGENAGVVRIDGDICACFKLESHNHPSYHDPFNGAATGIGGILRDVFTMGARPVAGLNSLRFGNFKNAKTKSLLKGAVEGMVHYGSNFGVPMAGGETFFHESFNGNPLVNAFILGIVREDKIFTSSATGVGNPVMYVGAKTGRDGILGAAMASEEIGEGSAVTVPAAWGGDPELEYRLAEACLELMKSDSVVAIQDMGAAGLTSSSFEMAGKSGNGIKMYLDKTPMKEADMNPYELMLSESQERMLLVAQKGREDEVTAVMKKWNLDVAVIGEVTNDGYVRLLWNGAEVACVPAAPLSESAPLYDRPYARPAWLDEVSKFDDNSINTPASLNDAFLKLLEDPNVASKSWIYKQFADKDGDVVTHFGGDAGIVKLDGSKKGVAMAVDCNSMYCYLNPREGAKHAVAESARNVAASGAKPVALTNCLNYPSPEKPEGMYQLVEGIEGLAEASLALDIPVISGNVSLYNETDGVGIYPTPTVAVVGAVDDVNKRIGSSFISAGNDIILLGKLPKSVAASEYLYSISGKAAGVVPDVDLAWHAKLLNFMYKGCNSELIASAHDTSKGGLSVALFEMTKMNNIGCNVTLPSAARGDALLFGETPMMILEVASKNLDAVKKLCAECALDYIVAGTTGGAEITIKADNGALLNVAVDKAVAVSEKTIPALLGL